MNKIWQTYHHYVYGVIAVVGTFAAIIGLGLLMTTEFWSAWAVHMAKVTGPFLNVIGVLFGLTLAFLANDTWIAHDRARAAVLREADAVRGLDILAETAPEATGKELHKAIHEYADAAVEEWGALARCEISSTASQAADRLLSRFSTLAGKDAGPEMLRNVAQIRENRDIRIGLSRTHVNPLKWFGMAFLGFLTLVSIAVVHATDIYTALIAMGLFGLASAPTAAIVLIHGNPFQPPSAVSPLRLANALTGR